MRCRSRCNDDHRRDLCRERDPAKDVGVKKTMLCSNLEKDFAERILHRCRKAMARGGGELPARRHHPWEDSSPMRGIDLRIIKRLVTATAQVVTRALPASVAVLGVALSVTPVAAGQTADKSMTVFVTASEPAPRGKPTEAERQQASAAIKAAQTTRSDLDKSLKAQFGNKRDKWPADARDSLRRRRGSGGPLEHGLAGPVGRIDPLPRNVSDLKDALQGVGLAGKKENVVVVAAPEEAQLIVEVNAVRTAGTTDSDTLNDQFWVNVLIKRGPRLSAEQFATVPQTVPLPGVHAARDAEQRRTLVAIRGDRNVLVVCPGQTTFQIGRGLHRQESRHPDGRSQTLKRPSVPVSALPSSGQLGS